MTAVQKVIERVVKDGTGKPVDGKRLAELLVKCQSEIKGDGDVTSGEGENKSRTRVIICGGDKHTNNAATREALATALDKARGRIGEHETLSEKGRAQATEALEREIARLRSQGR